MTAQFVSQRIPPLALTVIMILLMSLIAWQMPQFSFMLPHNTLVALCVAFIGAVISVAGVVSFRTADTTVNPNKPHQASTLVVRGIYRYSRNPMYLGFMYFLLAWGVFLAHLLSLLFPLGFVVYMNRFQIPLEEEALEEKFGEEFILYKNRVRRWL